MGGSHLGEHLIQPLQGTVQVNLNPAGCAGHVLPVVLCSPSLEKHTQTHKITLCLYFFIFFLTFSFRFFFFFFLKHEIRNKQTNIHCKYHYHCHYNSGGGAKTLIYRALNIRICQAGHMNFSNSIIFSLITQKNFHVAPVSDGSP